MNKVWLLGWMGDVSVRRATEESLRVSFCMEMGRGEG